LEGQGPPKHFADMQQATAAWRRGALKLTDAVTFGTEKQATLMREYIDTHNRAELLDQVLDEELPRYAEALRRLGQ
ncbi:MAG TPA: hypothetical protein PKX56_08270, partial [Marmoricola sp.]|nr:hypothetical protein [Marmoricola sp.]